MNIPPGIELERLQAELLRALPELHPRLEAGELVPAFTIDPEARTLTVNDPALEPRVALVLAAPANEQTLRDRAEQALATLEAAHAGWAGLTAAQKDATAKLCVRACAGLIRLVLRRLDAAP